MKYSQEFYDNKKITKMLLDYLTNQTKKKKNKLDNLASVKKAYSDSLENINILTALYNLTKEGRVSKGYWKVAHSILADE